MDSKKLGLEIQVNLFKFFFDSDYLHYGYWTPGLEVKAPNFKQAQSAFVAYLLKHIPPHVVSILDVGCGTGKVAEELIEKGYQVTCVSPPGKLTEMAADRLAGKSEVHAVCFEDLKIQQKFDLVLFCESYQYIPMEKTFQQCNELLNPGGFILLADFFQTETPGKSPLGGGHRLKDFCELLSKQPYQIRVDNDITDATAPTMELVNQLTMKVVYPSLLLLDEFLMSRYPLLYKFLRWKFRKKIEKNRIKHFTGQRSPENFKKYKSYRLLLLEKIAKHD